ncbi:glucose 1-dehydrogenase [Sphingomonas sp. PAMC 26617]|uniref:glucose 1-dehydrogenase n=1 Tax=Sphingomonas sp. PAMC 26617 TaxID=1112216 RepID=UPI0002883B84|nr:glucose 1-dehydrogenase [Sphingomonas sp. PAMC 26617]
MVDDSILAGKVAIVTGSGGGIGAGIVQRLAAQGAMTVVNYRSDAAAATKIVTAITSEGGVAIAVQADASDPGQIASLFDEAEVAFGPVDLLVNNAATRGPHASVHDVTLEQYDQIFKSNVQGPLLCTIEFARRAKRGGRIVNMTSGQARTPMPGSSLYAGTKGALEAFTRAFAADLGPLGITVNAVAPGATATDKFKTANSDAVKQKTIQDTALGRLGTPDDIADVVAFLLSDAAHWVTGQVLDANGGLRR